MPDREFGQHEPGDIADMRPPPSRPSPPRIPQFQVSLITCHGRAVAAEPAERDWKLVGDREEIGGWEIFTMTKASNGMVAFKTNHGKWVSAEPAEQDWVLRGNRDEVNGWELFTPEIHGDGVAFKTHHGRYVSAEPAERGFILRADRTEVQGWEVFFGGSDVRREPGLGLVPMVVPFFVRGALKKLVEQGVLRRIEPDFYERPENTWMRGLADGGFIHDAPREDRDAMGHYA